VKKEIEMNVFDLTTRFLIIGGGIAGVSAAETIHKLDPTARIILVSEEQNPPYFRMSLTRYLAGEIGRDKLDLHPWEWYPENEIEIIAGSKVRAISPKTKHALLEDGRTVGYEKLILANGASPFMPPIPGHELNGVMTLRSLEDVELILKKCQNPANVVCIGGGLLGLEIAGAIARHGAQVTVLEALDWLLPRQLGQEAAGILRQEIEKLGIKVIVPAKIKRLTGETRVERVELEDGTTIQTDLVLVSAGVRPNIALAKEAGIKVNRGVLVDRRMRTSDPDIFAAGDVTEHEGVCYGLWMPAKKQGEVAGKNAFGEPTDFIADPPSAKLKVLGLDLFSIGQFCPTEENDRLVTLREEGKYISLLVRDNKILGANLLGKTGLDLKVKKAIETGQDFDAFERENPIFRN
jgi:nitrite reductase (NADH) large subunit